MTLDRIFEIATEQHPRRIAVSFDDWQALSNELWVATSQNRGIYRKAIEVPRINYTRGDQCAYVDGVFVFVANDLNRGESRVE